MNRNHAEQAKKKPYVFVCSVNTKSEIYLYIQQDFQCIACFVDKLCTGLLLDSGALETENSVQSASALVSRNLLFHVLIFQLVS